MSPRDRTVIRGGDVIDGTRYTQSRRADVLVEGGRISAVEPLGAIDASVIDATGLVVAPGFIDLHSHSDFTLLVDPRACSALAQGVTTEVIGNCGHGCFPISDPTLARRAVYGLTQDADVPRASANTYLRSLDDCRPAVNVATLVPNGQLRMSVLAGADRIASLDEMASMRRTLEECLDEGAWGLSTGLEYPQERATSPDEIAALCEVVEGRDALYATHTRDRLEHAVEGVEEALAAAEDTGVRLQISHLTPRRGLDQTLRCVEHVERAAWRGSDVAFDMHTRLFGFTYLSALLPAGTLEGSPEMIRERLASVDFREKARRDVGMVNLETDASRVIVEDAGGGGDERSLREMADESGLTPTDVACDLLAGSLESPEMLKVRLTTYDEEQQLAVFPHPLCVPASDATSMCPTGPLAESVFHGAYSWAAWYLRFIVRESRSLGLAEAIHRLTQFPASRLGVSDRGVLRPGAAADIVVFDPDATAERATVTEPNRLATGMSVVMVNGELAIEGGRITGRRAGRTLRFGA